MQLSNSGIQSSKSSIEPIQNKIKLVTFIILIFSFNFANSTEVAFAGFAYSGNHQSINDRFPYSKRFESSFGLKGINDLIQKNISIGQSNDFTIVSRLEDVVSRDQSIAVALVMTNETVSTEQFGPIYKLFVQLRGQALFFDFKSKTVLRAYPFSFAYLDALPSIPTDIQKDEIIKYVYLGKNGKSGIIDRFSQALTQAVIPISIPRLVQVKQVLISDEARRSFPTEFSNGEAETWIADNFGESIASKMNIPILPYTKGYAIGNVMSMTVSDGSIYNLILPKPDYEFTINITKLRKVVYEDSAAGKSFIYGTYANLKLEEPISAHSYLDGQFKNGEVKVVPSTQLNTEDFPAYQDSMRGLFTKLADAISGKKSSWLKSATSSIDVEKQIESTQELLKLCK